MTTYTSNRDGGKTNEEGHYRFHVKAWSGNVLSGLQAQQKSPLSLGVDITVGDVKVDYSGYGYTAWTDAIESVTLTTADPSNPRIDRVVGYIDRGVTPSSGVTNNPGILKFKAVAGTPAGSPSAPNDAAVQASVGASNPWFNIANVTVGTGVTTISTANITDTRVLIGATIKDSSVTTAKVANGAVTTDKLTAVSFSGVMATGTITTTGFTGATINIPATTSPHKYQVVAVFVINHGGTADIRDYRGRIKLNGVNQKECQWSSFSGAFVNTISCTDIVTSSGDDITLTIERNTNNGGTLLVTSSYSVVDLGV